MSHIDQVLVVDDESYFRELFSIMLEDTYQIKVASSGEEALDILRTEVPDLVLMDVVMPGMDGYEVCKWMKEQAEYCDIPLIFLTVRGSAEEEAKGLSLGAVDYITKPISPPRVKARIKAHLELKSARVKLRNNILALEKMVAQRTTDLVAEIEERKAVENTLLMKQLEQQQALDNLLVGVVSFDETGKVVIFNHFAEVIFGYNAGDVIGDNFSMLFPSSAQQGSDSYLERYLQESELEKQGASGRQVYAVRKNNEIFPLQILLAELPVGNDGKRYFIGSFLDMTLLKKHEDQLSRLQKNETLKALTSGIVHDYNNVLGLILGYTEILNTQLQLGGHSDLIEYVEEIKKAAERGSKLASNILSFSSKQVAGDDAVNINVILLEQQFMLEKMLSYRIRFELSVSQDIWQTYLNKSELEDAILNFSTNALHAMPDGGTLMFATRNVNLNEEEATPVGLRAGDYVRLSISDTGLGMDQATQDKIFAPFFSTKGERGTGLGLAQVYRFIQRSKGAISVSSTVGEGTCFEIYFPRYQPA